MSFLKINFRILLKLISKISKFNWNEIGVSVFLLILFNLFKQLIVRNVLWHADAYMIHANNICFSFSHPLQSYFLMNGIYQPT